MEVLMQCRGISDFRLQISDFKFFNLKSEI